MAKYVIPRLVLAVLFCKALLLSVLYVAVFYDQAMVTVVGGAYFGLAIVVSNLGHEYAHYAAAAFLDAKPKWAVNRLSVFSQPRTFRRQQTISLAGPLAGGLVAFLMYLAPFVQHRPSLKLAMLCLATGHLAMLLPIFNDGMLILKRRRS